MRTVHRRDRRPVDPETAKKQHATVHAIDCIKPFVTGAKDNVHVVIDTPRGSRNKVKWDPRLGVFKLSHVLTAGAVFPFDFGFVPGTRAADGDALDVLVLADEPFFPGCLVTARVIGVLEAKQTQDGKTFRNDRLLAVAGASRHYAAVRELNDLPPTLLTEIEQFFINYNLMRDRVFKPIGRSGTEQAMAMVKASIGKMKKRSAPAKTAQ
jgi:inorganic pyrophosphatase